MSLCHIAPNVWSHTHERIALPDNNSGFVAWLCSGGSSTPFYLWSNSNLIYLHITSTVDMRVCECAREIETELLLHEQLEIWCIESCSKNMTIQCWVIEAIRLRTKFALRVLVYHKNLLHLGHSRRVIKKCWNGKRWKMERYTPTIKLNDIDSYALCPWNRIHRKWCISTSVQTVYPNL